MSTVVNTIRILDYCGIHEQLVKVGTKGVIAKGRNASGKTSFVNAVRAALSDRGVSPDAVKLGADKAEIFIALNDAVVKRTILAAGGTTITAESPDGLSEIKRPASYLKSLLGAGQIDPLALLAEKDKAKRRAAVVAALPLEPITNARLVELGVPVPSGVTCSGHPLEVVGVLTGIYTAQRKTANAEVERLKQIGLEARAKLEAMPAGKEDPAAAEWHAKAVRALATLDAQEEQAARSIAQAAATRESIAQRRARAAALRESAPAYNESDHVGAQNALAVAQQEIERLERELAAVRDRESDARARVATSAAAQRTRAHELGKADALESEAQAMESTLTAASVVAPTAEERAATERNLREAYSAAALHDSWKARAAVEAERNKIAAEYKASDARATELDAIVRKLRTDVPAALIAGSNAVPGLGIDGDEITLDGVALDRVNEAERLRLSVAIAKRATPKAKLIITDRLESIDPDAQDAFVQFATADGWQLIAARVERGDLTFEVLEP